MFRITKIILFLSCYLSCAHLSAQSDFLAPQEIDSLLTLHRHQQTWSEELNYLDMRFPLLLTLHFLENGELIGRLDYDDGSANSFLQGKIVRSDQWILQEMDYDENLIGFLELNGSLPDNIRPIRWYNAEKSRSFPIYPAGELDAEMPTEKGIVRYQSKRKEPCTEVYLKSLPSGYQVNILLDAGKYLSASLEPSSTDTEFVFSGNTAKLKDLRYDQAKNQIVLSDDRVCRLKKEQYLGKRHLQTQMNFSELLWIDLPKFEDAVFNLKMKDLINHHLFNSGCSANYKDEREHWRHYRKAEAAITHFSKDWISLNLRVLNTCSPSPTDTVLHINYSRKEKQFMPLHSMQEKMQEAGTTLPSCSDCQGRPKGYTLDNKGITLHHGFDLFLGECFCSVSWEELGYKNFRRWLRVMQ